MILLLICALVFHSAFTQSKQGKVMTNRASGTFEVKMSPQEADMSVGRMTIDKKFQGDLVGTSK